MNTLTTHINEALKIGKNLSRFSKYSCRPTNKDELKKIIDDRIEKEGPDCNLNDIDTSLITDMSYLFKYSNFTGDISCWNTSKVEDMSGMFYGTPFNSDISKWDTSNVKHMEWMFNDSDFNQPIGDWDVSKVTNMGGMFNRSAFNQPIGNWDVSNVKSMGFMFNRSNFNQDISKWNIRKGGCSAIRTFMKCPIRNDYKPKALQ